MDNRRYKTLAIHPPIHKVLRQQAADEERNIIDVLEQAITEYISKHKREVQGGTGDGD